MNDLAAMLRRRYRYTWAVFGAGFLLVCYRLPVEGEAFNIGPPLGLLLLYVVAGQLVATLCANWAGDYGYDPSTALFVATMKAGAVSAAGSVLLHLVILNLPFEPGMGAIEFRSVAAALIGGALFPFMGCLSAAASVGR